MIGGYAEENDGSRYESTIIARFQNDEWGLAGQLNVGRYGHSSITFDGLTMIIGGYTAK